MRLSRLPKAEPGLSVYSRVFQTLTYLPFCQNLQGFQLRQPLPLMGQSGFYVSLLDGAGSVWCGLGGGSAHCWSPTLSELGTQMHPPQGRWPLTGLPPQWEGLCQSLYSPFKETLSKCQDRTAQILILSFSCPVSSPKSKLHAPVTAADISALCLQADGKGWCRLN